MQFYIIQHKRTEKNGHLFLKGKDKRRQPWMTKLELSKTLKQLLQKCLNKQSHLATEVKTENWRYKKNQMEILEQYPKLKYTKSSQQQNGEDREVSEF